MQQLKNLLVDNSITLSLGRVGGFLFANVWTPTDGEGCWVQCTGATCSGSNACHRKLLVEDKSAEVMRVVH
jgi:hypothetical protein